MPEIIFSHFPNLNSDQRARISELKCIYEEWNARINLISRKDFNFFYERHVLHSLSISKFIDFEDGSKILDFGTGGGFPGIPLAILYPNCSFLLVDSIQKKIGVVKDVIKQLQIENANAQCQRVEEINDKFDYITGRAVKNLVQILKWTRPLLNGKSKKNKTGIYYLKGGEFSDELKKTKMKSKVYDLNDLFFEEFFETKKLIHFYL